MVNQRVVKYFVQLEIMNLLVSATLQLAECWNVKKMENMVKNADKLLMRMTDSRHLVQQLLK